MTMTLTTPRAVLATPARTQSAFPEQSVIALFRSTEEAMAATAHLVRTTGSRAGDWAGVSIESGRAAVQRLRTASSNRINALLHELSEDAALLRHLVTQAAAGGALVTMPAHLYSPEALDVLQAGGATEVYRTGRWVTERLAPRRGR